MWCCVNFVNIEHNKETYPMRYLFIAVFSAFLSYVLVGSSLFMFFYGPNDGYRFQTVLASVMLVAGVALSALVWRSHPQCRIPMVLLTVAFVIATKMCLDYSFAHLPI